MKLAFVFLTVSLVAFLNGGAAAQMDPCASSADLGGPGALNAVFMSCPRGDGPTPAQLGWFLALTIMDSDTLPIPGIPATDIWLEDCIDFFRPIIPCGPGASAPDGPTDALGMTRFSTGTFAVSGCGYYGPLPALDAVQVLVQGVPIGSPGVSCMPGSIKCWQVRVRSVDVTEDGTVGLGDVASFAQGLLGAYNPCVDFNFDGFVGIADLAYISLHVGLAHSCP